MGAILGLTFLMGFVLYKRYLFLAFFCVICLLPPTVCNVVCLDIYLPPNRLLTIDVFDFSISTRLGEIHTSRIVPQRKSRG